MTHIPNKYDIVTDLRRCLSSTYGVDLFEDENVKVFLEKAEVNLNLLQDNIEAYPEIIKRIEKAKDGNNLIEKRREDLLMASCLLF